MEPSGWRSRWYRALVGSVIMAVGLATAPVAAQETPVITSLVQQFPPAIAGSPLEIITFSGEEWLAGFGDSEQKATFESFLEGLGVVGPEALSTQAALASGVFINSLGASTALTAIAVCPAESSALVDNTLGLYGKVGEPRSTVLSPLGESVLTGTAHTGSIWVRAMSKFTNVVWLVDAAEPALAEIMTAIPAVGVTC